MVIIGDARQSNIDELVKKLSVDPSVAARAYDDALRRLKERARVENFLPVLAVKAAERELLDGNKYGSTLPIE